MRLASMNRDDHQSANTADRLQLRNESEGTGISAFPEIAESIGTV
jgi:hypothetical protein